MTKIEKIIIGTIIACLLIAIPTAYVTCKLLVKGAEEIDKHGIKSVVDRVWEGRAK